MLKMQTIQESFSEFLQNHGYRATPNEKQEGFTRPTFFVEVFPTNITTETDYMSLVELSVELRWFDEHYTHQGHLAMADTLREILMAQPLKIADRAMTVQSLNFDKDEDALICEIDLEFMDDTGVAQPLYEPIQDLELQTNI
jgi:hypothetical protein